MATTPSRQGALLGDRYLLERKLGAGGMADVWLAEDRELGRKVAVKILHERYASDEQFVGRFRREATSAAALSHPNVVSIFDRGETDGSYFIVMEYVEGKTLKELIITRGVCPPAAAIGYVRQVLAALRYAHRNGIIHRDIKPHNVIVDGEDHAKVMDFGIARAGSSEMTEAGSILGTAQYLSPEQARGAPVEEGSDLYSTGIVLYELLTGQVPFTGGAPVELAMKHLSQAPEPPSAHRPDLPPGLDAVVLRALAKEPTNRYRSAEEMDRDLGRILRGEPVGRETEEAATMVLRAAGEETQVLRTGRVPPPGRASQRPERDRRAWWPWLAGLGVVLLLAVGALAGYGQIRDRLHAAEPVPVDNYEGILESRAVELIRADGFEEQVRRLPNADVDEGYVFDQEPDPGAKLPPNSTVTILVSAGDPEVTAPPLVGMTRDQAVAALAEVGLEVNVVEVSSDREPGEVTAQSPQDGEVLHAGDEVRINVSKGVKPIPVPSVVGLQVDIAEAQLQVAGFTVGRVDVEGDAPAGEVVSQSPPADATAASGASVTLSVSMGPATVAVPDVTLSELADARKTLRAAGFVPVVARQDTDDETLDGVVLDQSPPGDGEAESGAEVTLIVGRFVPPPA